MQDVATDPLDRRSSRSRGLRETIWAYFRTQWKEAFRVELTSRRSQALFRRSQEQSADEIAAEVFVLMQRVPDGCEDPQTVLFNLARTVIERNESTPAAARGESPTSAQSLAASNAMLKHEIDGFDPDTRKMLEMHVDDGMPYTQIAVRLGMKPERVLGCLTRAYSQLRLRAEPIEPSPIASSEHPPS